MHIDQKLAFTSFESYEYLFSQRSGENMMKICEIYRGGFPIYSSYKNKLIEA